MNGITLPSSREKYIEEVTVGDREPHNGKVVLEEYNSNWSVLFEREAERIRSILGNRAIQIHHVGSTAVPGLCAKPIIDIVLVVQNSSAESSYVTDLEAAGYRLHIREPDWFNHRLLKELDTDINLHVFSEQEPEVERMIIFRDWLRNHEDDRHLYATVKHELSRRDWQHIQHYADAKTAIIQEIMERAMFNTQ